MSPSATEEIELDSEGHFIVDPVDILRTVATMSNMRQSSSNSLHERPQGALCVL